MALSNQYYRITEPPATSMTIIAKVTNMCNLDCQYCYDMPFRKALGHNGILDIEKLEHLIKIATEHAEEVDILWHGGEPSLAGLDYYDKVCEEILPKYPYCEMSINMQTNGTLIDDEWCEFCKKNNMGIGSSYNATQEDLRHTVDNPEGTSETSSISLAFNNIKKAIKNGLSAGVIDVMTKENHKRMIQIYEFYKKEGVHACFNEINAAGEANKHDFLFITPEDKESYLKHTEEYFTYWCNDKDDECFIDRYASEYIQLLLTGQSHVCHNGNGCLYHWIGINSNGDLYPCDRALPEIYRIGNVMDFNSMEEVYKSKVYDDFAGERSYKLQNRCSKCEVNGYCHGNCPMIDIDATGTASEANTYACEMQRLNIKAAYNSLLNTDIDKCNIYLRRFLIENCVFLPGEIMPLIKHLGLKDRFKEYDYSERLSSFSSKEFRLFAAINSTEKENWITDNYCEMFDTQAVEDTEDDRFECAYNSLKKRAVHLEHKLKADI